MTPRRLTLVSGDRSWDVAMTGDGRIELEGRTYAVTRGPSGGVVVRSDDGQVLAHAIADAYALTIVGGGETAMAIHRAGESENISFISTGGGAALELLEGKPLPGLVALPERKD